MKKKIGEEINRLTWISIFYDKWSAVEKDGLPASAGGMCGPLFSQIVDGLLLP